MTQKNVHEYFEKNRVDISKIETVKDVVESQIGTLFYDAFLKLHSKTVGRIS